VSSYEKFDIGGASDDPEILIVAKVLVRRFPLYS